MKYMCAHVYLKKISQNSTCRNYAQSIPIYSPPFHFLKYAEYNALNRLHDLPSAS